MLSVFVSLVTVSMLWAVMMARCISTLLRLTTLRRMSGHRYTPRHTRNEFLREWEWERECSQARAIALDLASERYISRSWERASAISWERAQYLGSESYILGSRERYIARSRARASNISWDLVISRASDIPRDLMRERYISRSRAHERYILRSRACMSELYILRFRERATYLEITHEELYTYCSLVKTSNKSLNPPIKSLYKHRMSVWPPSSSSPMYLGMFSWYLNVCFPHANIVLATTQVKESWAISFNRSVSHFSLYLISRLRDFQPKSLDICYFGDTHHAENERGWRWADTDSDWHRGLRRC